MLGAHETVGCWRLRLLPRMSLSRAPPPSPDHRKLHIFQSKQLPVKLISKIVMEDTKPKIVVSKPDDDSQVIIAELKTKVLSLEASLEEAGKKNGSDSNIAGVSNEF